MIKKHESQVACFGNKFRKGHYKGSHGPNDLAAYHSQLADIFSFALWQIGHPDFQLTQ